MATSRNSNAKPPEETRLDEDVDKPSTTAPGDGPADTTDPSERAVSVPPDVKTAALAGHGTVNAVVPVDPPATVQRDPKKDRTETYEQVSPVTGKTVKVERNIETGESKLV